MVLELFRKTDEFRRIYLINESIFLVEEICDLTGFCVPSIRKKLGTYRIDYEIGITVTFGSVNSEKRFKENISNRRFLILPRTISTAHSLDMLVLDNKISPWLVNDMICMMRRYSLPREKALAFLSHNEDKFLSNLKSVYGNDFDEDILGPLQYYG
jgi:hypothetical protein